MLAAGHPLRHRWVSAGKVTNYLLNLASPGGHDKAKFFMSLGFVSTDGRVLAAALYDHPDCNPVVDTWSNRWGTRYDVVGPIRSPDGHDPTILTAWIDDGAGPVRLVIALPA